MQLPYKQWLIAFTVINSVLLAIIWDTGYKITSLESLAVFILGCSAAAALSLLAKFSEFLFKLCLVLLFITFIDLFIIQNYWWLIPIALITAFLVFLKGEQGGFNFLMVFSAVLLIGIYLNQGALLKTNKPFSNISYKNDRTYQPLVIQLVMDEMGSFNSIPAEFRSESDIKELRAAYQQRGFEILDDLPSQSAETQVSLTRLVDTTDKFLPKNLDHGDAQFKYQVRENSVHETFLNRGWGVNIVQSDFLDFCKHQQFKCATYSRGNHAHFYSTFVTEPKEKMKILFNEILNRFSQKDRNFTPLLLMKQHFPKEFFSVVAIRSQYSSRTLAMIEILNQYGIKIGGKHYNEFYFLHLLLPHFPWILDKSCGVLPLEFWETAEWVDKKNVSVNIKNNAKVFNAYWNQTYCAHKRLLAFIDVIDNQQAIAPIFLIHGDHGPRILARRITKEQSLSGSIDNQMRANVLNPFIALRVPLHVHEKISICPTMQCVIRGALLEIAENPKNNLDQSSTSLQEIQ